MTYDHLASATMSPGSPTPESYEEARRTWLCGGCALPRPGTGAVNVHLDAAPEDIPLSFVSGLGVGIIRRDLLEALGDDVVAASLQLGEVFGPDGKRLSQYATFRGKRMVILRGNATSSHRRCDSCGRLVYFPMGKRYLVAPFASRFESAESQFNQLVVSERIHDRITAKKWRKLTVEKLKTRDRGFDGQDYPTDVEN